MLSNNSTALIIGNGPSVDMLRPDQLTCFATYGCNHIYKKFKEWGRATDNVVITDSNRINEIGRSYQNYKGNLYVGDQRYINPPVRKIKKILGRDFIPINRLCKRSMPKNWLTTRIAFSRYFFSTVFDNNRFEFNLHDGLNFGASVTISAIQLAVIKGYKRILLTGVDSHYAHAKSYFSGMEDSVNYVNPVFISNPRLFMEPLLTLLQVYFEELGIELVDCTPGGALKYIRKGKIEDFC